MTHSRAAYELAVAQVIDKLHDQSGLPREKLAEALDMPDLEVTRLENGSEPLSAGGLVVLLKLYGLSWPDFERKVTEELPGAQARIDRASHQRSP